MKIRKLMIVGENSKILEFEIFFHLHGIYRSLTKRG